MSMRLVTKIKETKGIPGKYKRVLEAWASWASNDGTNIWAAAKTVADRAGISRWTVYRHTEVFVAVGVLKVAASHTCKTKGCSHGSNHFTGTFGHYTTAYNIDLEALPMLQDESSHVAKTQKVNVAKCLNLNVAKTQKVNVAKCQPNQVLNTNLAQDDTSYPPSPVKIEAPAHSRRKTKQVSKEAIRMPAAPSILSHRESQSQNQTEYKFYTRLELIEQLRAAIDPKIQPDGEDWITEYDNGWNDDGTVNPHIGLGFSNGIFVDGGCGEWDTLVDEIGSIWNEHTAGTISCGDGDELDDRMLIRALMVLDGYESVRRVLLDAVVNHVPAKNFLGWTDFKVFARNYMVNKLRSQHYRSGLVSRHARSGVVVR
jgi:hypothetical protein